MTKPTTTARESQLAAETGESLHLSPLATDLGFLLARANALSLAASNAALTKHGLRVRSYSVLALAAGGGRPSQREIADFLLLDPSQVVALVDDLESRGLLRREPDPKDRRANVVVVTNEGAALFDRAEASAHAAQRDFCRSLTVTQQDQLAVLLRTLAFPGGVV
ncbi:MAG: MarR family transcriptional regulator [Microbacteriaceae bacterium]